MQTQQNFVFFLLKLILYFFSGEPKLLLFPKIGKELLVLKNYSSDCQYEMMNYYQRQKLQYFSQNHYQNSTNLNYQILFYSHNKHT